MIKNLFFFKRLMPLGGTEQFLYEIVKKYSNDYHIAVAFEEASPSQAARLAKYVDLIRWQKGMKIECDRAFLNFNIEIIDDLICDDITFVCHANFEQIGYKPPVHPRIDRTVAVSEFTKEIYERHYSIPCRVSYNPITLEDYQRPLVLMSAFRIDDPVRGLERCRKLADLLDEYCCRRNRKYVWLIFGQNPCVKIGSPNVVILPPRVDVRAYMKMADWGVNLPDNMETYGYTNVEFLMYGIPIVTTPLSVCEELKMDSSMRLVLDYDLSNVEEIIEKMFTKRMHFSYQPPADRWNELLSKGEGRIQEKQRMKLFRVKANSFSYDRQIHLMELDRPAQPGEVFETTEDRLDNLVKGHNRWGEPFAELIGEVKKEEEPKKKTARKK